MQLTLGQFVSCLYLAKISVSICIGTVQWTVPLDHLTPQIMLVRKKNRGVTWSWSVILECLSLRERSLFTATGGWNFQIPAHWNLPPLAMARRKLPAILHTFFFRFAQRPPSRWSMVAPYCLFCLQGKTWKLAGFCAHFLFRESTDHDLFKNIIIICQCVTSVPPSFPGKLWSNPIW